MKVSYAQSGHKVLLQHSQTYIEKAQLGYHVSYLVQCPSLCAPVQASS